MIYLLFAIKINAILADGTEVKNVVGYIENNKKYYKTEDNTILTGTKKVKEIKSCEYVVLPQLLPRIRHYINE